jgi:hypothetical protein
MCNTHYASWYRKQNPAKFEHYKAKRRKGPSLAEIRTQRATQTKVCAECGATFTRQQNRSHAQWDNQTCCTLACANAVRAKQQTNPTQHDTSRG